MIPISSVWFETSHYFYTYPITCEWFVIIIIYRRRQRIKSDFQEITKPEVYILIWTQINTSTVVSLLAGRITGVTSKIFGWYLFHWVLRRFWGTTGEALRTIEGAGCNSDGRRGSRRDTSLDAFRGSGGNHTSGRICRILVRQWHWCHKFSLFFEERRGTAHWVRRETQAEEAHVN